jgi:hypothetical protein
MGVLESAESERLKAVLEAAEIGFAQPARPHESDFQRQFDSWDEIFSHGKTADVNSAKK